MTGPQSSAGVAGLASGPYRSKGGGIGSAVEQKDLAGELGGVAAADETPRLTRELRLFPQISGKADGTALRLRRVHEFADRREDGGDSLVMVLELMFELVELASQRGVRGEQCAQPRESPHDLYVDGDGTPAVQHRGEHGHALLGEGVGEVLAVLPATWL